MTTYIDSSVLLRIVLGQPDKLGEWRSIDDAVSSALIEVECLRTLDRFRLVHGLSDREITKRRSAVYRLLEEIDLVEVTRALLARASQPMPVSLGTLGAIHLATALLWREQTAQTLRVATHDRDLGRAAEAVGFSVIGTSN